MSEGEFRSVLVPVEFESLEQPNAAPGEAFEVGDHEWIALGPYTIRALELAARLARSGELWLVHAHHDFSDYATWMAPANMDELNRAASRHATAVLEAAALRHCPNVTLHYVIEPGAPLDVILKLAEAHPPDAIVLAASSRGRLNRAFHGSTADKVIRRAGCPVIVVPSGTF